MDPYSRERYSEVPIRRPEREVVHHADQLPTRDSPVVDDFYTDSDPIVSQGNGGLLAIIPVLGGSGPQSLAGFPASLGLGTEARNAISVPLNDPDPGTQVVGAPQLTMTYSGIGTSRHVYAQVVDKSTGQVVGNIVTPIPVTLDGRTHTQTYSMENIVWTYDDSVPDATRSGTADRLVGHAVPELHPVRLHRRQERECLAAHARTRSRDRPTRVGLRKRVPLTARAGPPRWRC